MNDEAYEDCDKVVLKGMKFKWIKRTLGHLLTNGQDVRQHDLSQRVLPYSPDAYDAEADTLLYRVAAMAERADF